MQRLGILVIAAIGLTLPATATAVTIHQHVRDPLTHKPIVRVVTVPPKDSDDDGCANSQDNYSGPGCHKPPPPPEPAATTAPAVSAPASTTTAPTVTTGTPPAYIAQCESGGSYTATNPDSGAYGKWQILPSTSSAYGCDMSTPAGQDACAAEIYSDVGSSAWSCG